MGRQFDSGTDALYTAFLTLVLIWRIGLQGRNKKVRGVERHYRLERESYQERCGGRGFRVFAGRSPAASDLIGIYEDVGTVLITLSTSSVLSFRFSTSVSSGSAISAIRMSTGDYPFERKIFPPVSST